MYRFVAYLGPFVLVGFSWLAFRRLRPYYVQHLILALHIYSFWFLLSSLTGGVGWLRGTAILVTTVYLFLTARRVFGGATLANVGRAVVLRVAHIVAEFLVIALTLQAVVLWASSIGTAHH